MERIDAHQHFWKYDPVRDSWITEDMATIRRDFLPRDLEPLLKENGIDGCVAVQADQSEQETLFLLDLAEKYPFIRGVVGWIDLQAPNVDERLEYYSSFKKLKGFRHILQGEQCRDLMLKVSFKRGIAGLQRYGFTYDILIFPDELGYAKELAAAFPLQKFVVDHLAKPPIKSGKIEEWKEGIKALAAQENVWCKISGFVTEGDWAGWKPADFIPYFETVVNALGIDRILFGSDWPVCLVAAEYKEVFDTVKNYFSSYTSGEQNKFLGQNAIQFYNL
jgi:L-fuconolactonase